MRNDTVQLDSQQLVEALGAAMMRVTELEQEKADLRDEIALLQERLATAEGIFDQARQLRAGMNQFLTQEKHFRDKAKDVDRRFGKRAEKVDILISEY
jgi:hypothetical protein